MYIKGMTKEDYRRMLGESNEDIDDVLDGYEEAPESLFRSFEDRDDED